MSFIIAQFDDVMMTSRPFGFKGLLGVIVLIDSKEKNEKMSLRLRNMLK
jgi:hypothetical protein